MISIVAGTVVGIVGMIPLIGWVIAGIAGLIWLLITPLILILWLLLMYKAFKGERFKLPIVGDFAEKQINK